MYGCYVEVLLNVEVVLLVINLLNIKSYMYILIYMYTFIYHRFQLTQALEMKLSAAICFPGHPFIQSTTVLSDRVVLYFR